MKYIDNGCFFTVKVTRDEVERFKSTWPCSGLPERALWFQFDKRNGDLVDMGGAGNYDGSDLLALSQDAQKWGDEIARVERLAGTDLANR